MDPVTHGLIGALAGSCAVDRTELRPAAAIGLVAALVPDLDILIRSADDPLITLEAHRQYTHAFIALPVVTLVVSGIAWPIVRRFISVPGILLAAFVGALSAMLLDACTSYGTSLFWPFSHTRIALNIIAIVDPLLSCMALTLLIIALTRERRVWAAWGLCVSFAYLGFGWLQHERASYVAQVLANDRGHRIDRLEVKPTLGNILLWRTVYLSGQHVHADAVRLGLFAGVSIYEGDTVRLLEPRTLPVPPGSTQHRDVERFTTLSDGYVVYHPAHSFVVGDARFSMLPNSLRPLWGIKLDPGEPDDHVEFVTFRDTHKAIVETYLSMLLGRPVENEP